jgi:hypothetical protein
MVRKYYIGSLLIQRYGHLLTPRWFFGALVTAPAAGVELVGVDVSAGKKGYIYGFYISASEANDFNLEWTDQSGNLQQYRIVLAGKGTVHYADIVPINEGIAAQGGSRISIKVVNAGSTGSYYKAGVLEGEVVG